MITIRKIMIQTLCSLLFLNGIGQESKRIHIGTEYIIKSKVLNEDRAYIVGLPASYDSTKNSYPVMVITDGDYRFVYSSGIMEFLSKQNKIPETILVAIKNIDRNRDLIPTHLDSHSASGGGGNFLDFIEKELLPEIDSKYRTNKYRVLTGHSFGGLFSGFAYLNNSSFSGYVATDPAFAWDSQYIVNEISQEKIEPIKDKRIYISSADNYARNKKGVTMMRNSQELFFSKLKNSGVSHSNVKLQYFENENHGTSAYISAYYGFLFVFENFMPENIYNKSAAEISEHYKELSNKTDCIFLPPDHLIRKIADYNYKTKKDAYAAIELLKMNASNYPLSINYEKLGDLFKSISNHEEALFYYELSLDLNSNDSKKIMKKIEEIRNK
ncbi:alpha/beta hydrolase-fold protein [Tamlana sp. 2201CG12-4]|uniref:alpha/beta hydrolase n=1 Tax=Tamlana sp. 2201CG12-4 TaxID=3112582 RepID=UPI002DBD1ED0|nr:alpha/beta hydrolase-fold protein [Tamlana sp. 2201CG12-4]MEC3907633.1 alpha/beta hydrolase-fold protein [Tamlana sp. 2201CG12-4]